MCESVLSLLFLVDGAGTAASLFVVPKTYKAGNIAGRCV